MRRRWMAMLIMALGVGSIMPMGWAAEEILLRVGETQPLDYPTTAGLRQMQRYLEERSEGRIRMIIYPDAELGSEREAIEMVQIGALDIARVSAAVLAEYAPSIGILSLPYLFRNEDHQWAVLESDVGKQLLYGLAEQRLIGLCFYEAGARGFYTRSQPIRRPEDLKHLKLGIPPSHILEDIVQTFQAIPTQMAADEVYSALKLGVIDGAEGNLLTFYRRRHFTIAKYFTLDEHCRIPDVVIMSPSSWNELSAQDQYLLQRAALESVTYERQMWDQLEEEARKELRAAGVELLEPNREVRALFMKAVEPVRRKYRNRDLELRIQVVPDSGVGG